jgi:hypothetical protein
VHASEVDVVPAVTMNVVTRLVPATVAVIVTSPAAEPRVTRVLAWPNESVVVVVGDRLAAPTVTANVTDAPLIGVLLAPVTLTTSGRDSGCPTIPT